jgi:large subunit ribosomal protein L3
LCFEQIKVSYVLTFLDVSDNLSELQIGPNRTLSSFKMKFIVGKKMNMLQVFDNGGKAIAGTLVFAPAVTVVQVKDDKTDGYKSVQIGYGSKKQKNLNKALIGHSKGLGFFEGFKEFRVTQPESFKVGDKITVDVFKEGDKVTVSSVSKGKGFQGVVKRHGFGGGRRTHGQKHSEREPGSIGGGGRAGGRVAKGMRMAGRMGGERVTVKNLKVIAVDSENSLLLLSGAIPGRKGAVVEVRS